MKKCTGKGGKSLGCPEVAGDNPSETGKHQQRLANTNNGVRFYREESWFSFYNLRLVSRRVRTAYRHRR